MHLANTKREAVIDNVRNVVTVDSEHNGASIEFTFRPHHYRPHVVDTEPVGGSTTFSVNVAMQTTDSLKWRQRFSRYNQEL